MWASIGALLLIAVPPSASDPSAGPRQVTISTKFGQVKVDADNVQAAIDEGEAARSAAGKVMGLPDPRFQIAEMDGTSYRWSDQTADGAIVYVWQFRKNDGDPRPPPPAYLLRHEIGHDLFIRYLVPSTKPDQYGGDAPDWLDEMAAVAFEGDALRSGRRRSAAKYAREAGLIPLQRFLTMVHPEMESRSIPVSVDGRVRAFEPASDETPRFYDMASAFYEFLVARTKNPAIVAELAAAFRKGEPLERWILARTWNKKGIEALDADFQAWIASDSRYGGRIGL